MCLQVRPFLAVRPQAKVHVPGSARTPSAENHVERCYISLYLVISHLNQLKASRCIENVLAYARALTGHPDRDDSVRGTRLQDFFHTSSPGLVTVLRHVTFCVAQMALMFYGPSCYVCLQIGAGVGILAALFISGCIATAAAEDLSFASVPTSHNVAQADLPKLAECLIDCAANPANVLAPFSGEPPLTLI